MYDLLSAAINGRNDEGYDFCLTGDLCQMRDQKRFLKERGFKVGQINVYPALKSEDVLKALTLIWKCKITGWWHYQSKYEELGICTEEEFGKRLHKEVG